MKYDVVIIGAGIAGLECAKNLIKSNKKILLLERNSRFFAKTCACGITKEDLSFIDKKYLNFNFKNIKFIFGKKSFSLPENHKVISTFDRQKYLKDKFRQVTKASDLDFKQISGYKIVDNHTLKIIEKNSNKITGISFDYLIACDGAISKTRDYLKLSSKKQLFAIQYRVENKFNEFEAEFDNQILGYKWVFPQKDFSYIGTGMPTKKLNAKKLKKLLDDFIIKKSLDPKELKIEGALINFDYQGYKFDNIYLAGDAAGLASGLTGKGIYSAHLSAKQITNEILGIKSNLLEKWLQKKKGEEKIMTKISNKIGRKFFLNLAFKLAKKPEFIKRLLKHL